MKSAPRFYYFINLNERDEFNADVRNENNETIFEIKSTEHLEELVQDGFISHCHDMQGIHEYLVMCGTIPFESYLHRGNSPRFSY